MSSSAARFRRSSASRILSSASPQSSRPSPPVTRIASLTGVASIARAFGVVVAVSGVALILGAAPSGCSSDAASTAPVRTCGLTVWHKPASAEAHVEIIGDWDGWKRPGIVPELQHDDAHDGWRVALLEPPPGEHAYAIIEDGVWLTDKSRPMSAFHEDHEVAFEIVPDCTKPMIRVDRSSSTVDGHATVHATFLASRAGTALDPATITATTRDGTTLAVTHADASNGTVTFETNGLARGKYTFIVRANDTSGAAAEDAVATVWVEARAWDPRDAIVYQVVLDRFRGASGPLASPATPSSRAGGDLAGLRQALDAGEIEALGVNTLWLSPLYKNPEGEFAGTDGRSYTSYHGYWPIASRALDERVATEAELDDFMRAAHARGIRVLFDVVPNHVHAQHPWVKEHPDWFNGDGTCICGQGSCDWATNIKTCWFAPYLPDLDWTKPEVSREATADVMWWFDRWDADGLRIDAVPMTPRAATRRIVSTARRRYEHPGNVPYILGENFTGPGAYDLLRYDLGPFGLDGSFNFPFMWTLRQVLGAESSPMSEIDASFRAGEMAWTGSGAIMGTMVGNHDVARFASVSAGSDGGDTWSPAPQPLDPTIYAKQRVALGAVFTVPGAPVLYYGDEVGLAGKSDPDCRRVMPAESDLLPAQVATRDLARTVGRARACSNALRRGELVTVLGSAERYVFARTLAADATSGTTEDFALVALSRRPAEPTSVVLPLGAPERLVDVVTGARVTVEAGALTLDADAFGVHVFVSEDSPCAAP